MSRYAGICNVLRQIRNQRFTFIKYQQEQEFNCFMCHGSGQNGYVLEDASGERIIVGETCFRGYFLISPCEITQHSGGQACPFFINTPLNYRGVLGSSSFPPSPLSFRISLKLSERQISIRPSLFSFGKFFSALELIWGHWVFSYVYFIIIHNNIRVCSKTRLWQSQLSCFSFILKKSTIKLNSVFFYERVIRVKVSDKRFSFT